MAVILTPFQHGDLCHGWSWTITDEDELARQIAITALGQSRHVERILAGAQLGPPPTTASSAAAAMRMLTVPGNDPSHRDGWVFQVISWIAAHRATPGGLIRSPQMRLADKGFDGLQLELDTDNHVVTAAILFEDKATVNPRETIRSEVWPDFSKLESGDRDNILTAEVIALLKTQPSIDPDRAIRNVIWSATRQYRVSITIGATHANDEGREKLFRGYDTVAGGPVRRRRGEVFEIQHLREWMAQLAARAILTIVGLVERDV
jgi:hypothetical protein